jgi:hypothetical protein
MILYFGNTELDLPVNENSYRYRAIRGENGLTLHFALTEHVEIPVGAYCMFEGQTYTLERPENFIMRNTRNFEYTLVLDAPQSKLQKYKFKDTTTRRLKFTLTAKPREHLQMLVDNMNIRESGWTLGTCIDAIEKPVSYNHAYCIDALNQITDEFETEWEIAGKEINLRKVEYNKDTPLPLSYGRGNGFKPGLGRSNTDDSKPVAILYVQGGDRNIDASKYGSTELLLPKNQTLIYEGRTYISDEDGLSICRADKQPITGDEDSLDCSHIYPSRVGTISTVTVVDAENHLYDIIDSSIPSNLNFEDCLIDGETMTIIFQDGMLTGKEFDVNKYHHTDRRFEIVPQNIDGRPMPDSIFKPVVGGKYAVFGMMMPDAYICDNATKTGASWDMFREAAKYLYDNEEQKFTFTGELDGIWAKKDWLNIGGKIKLGGYILFSDDRFQPDGVLIRIIGVKDYINNPHSPIIELSNSTVGNSIYSDLRKIESDEVVVDNKFDKAIQYSKRTWHNAVESLGIMEEAMLKNFTESISPVTIRTMAALIGDESLQFKFVSNKTNPVPVEHRITFDNDTKVLNAPAGIIQHMTMGIDAAAPTHNPSEYKFWDILEFNSPPLDDSKKYYLYAKVSASNQTGQFYLSETAKQMDLEAGYYYLWVGFLNSAYDGERTDFVNVNRFTEILPGQMTIDLIRDELARLVIDLANARIIAKNGAEIIGKITFSEGSSGYENLTDKPDMSAYEEAVNYIDNVLPESLERLQSQIDGTIESYFYHYDPTMSNVPASDWVTSEDREKHLDDTFTNLDSGQSWRFTKDSNVYSWTLMDDSAATKALVLAGEAQDTADGKRRVFVATPYPPYDVGDLWTQGTSGELMRCQTARLSGSYVSSDWMKAVKYTDDTTANSAYNIAGSALDAAEAASNKANTAQGTANNAQTTANAAAKVLYATSAPTSGMKTNDLWVNGTLIYRYNGSSWVAADKYDVQMTIVNGGLVSTGAIIFGSTGGMSASGSIRIWSGGTSNDSSTGTFRVLSDGTIYARNSVRVENPNKEVVCGFSSDGTNMGTSFDDPGSIRIWAGSATPSSGKFRVTNYGYVFGTQFITNGLKGRMDDLGFQFGDYSGSAPYAFLHTNNNPLLRLRSNLLPLEIQYNGGLNGTAINIKNTYGWDNATFQFGYYRYGSEEFGRPFIKMVNPLWKRHFSNADTRNVVWDMNSGYLMIDG